MGLSAGLLGHDAADVDQVVGNHPEADPALDSGIPLVPAATQSMPSFDHADATLAAGPPFLAVAEPTLLLFAFALRALGGGTRVFGQVPGLVKFVRLGGQAAFAVA